MRLHRVSNSVLALSGGGAANTAINAAWGLSFRPLRWGPPSPRTWPTGARAGVYHTKCATTAQIVLLECKRAANAAFLKFGAVAGGTTARSLRCGPACPLYP